MANAPLRSTAGTGGDMTRAEAWAILDAASNYEDCPTWQITEALRTTGDLDPDEVVHILTTSGAWKRSTSGMAPAQWFGVLA